MASQPPNLHTHRRCCWLLLQLYAGMLGNSGSPCSVRITACACDRHQTTPVAGVSSFDTGVKQVHTHTSAHTGIKRFRAHTGVNYNNIQRVLCGVHHLPHKWADSLSIFLSRTHPWAIYTIGMSERWEAALFSVSEVYWNKLMQQKRLASSVSFSALPYRKRKCPGMGVDPLTPRLLATGDLVGVDLKIE